MIPVALVAAAIGTAAPSLDPAARARYANDIASVAETIEDGLALVTVARYESDFRGSVERCLVTGDHGSSIGIYQLEAHWLGGHTRAEVCASNRLSSALAAAAIARLRRITGSYELVFRRYVGTTQADDPRVAARVALFQRLVGEVPIDT